MKYSLRDQYKNLLKEEDTQDQLVNSSKDLVRVEFPGDPPNIARYYDLDDAVNKKNQDTFEVKLNSILDLGIISYIDTGLKGIIKSSGSLTDASISKKKSLVQTRLKKVLMRIIFDFINKKIVNNLINLEQKLDYDLKKILSELSEEEFQSFFDCLIPIYKKIVDSNVIGTSQGIQDASDFFNKDEDTTLEKLLIDILNDFYDDQNKSVLKVEYIKEEFTSFNFQGPNENNTDTCFRSWCKPSIISNEKTSFTLEEFFTDRSHVNKMFSDAREILQYYIDFKIQSKNSEFNKESFFLSSIGKNEIVKAISYEYCENVTTTTLISDFKKAKVKREDIRKNCNSIEEAIDHLNKISKEFKNYEGKGGKQGSVKGVGEFHVHMFLKTTNACLDLEPDAVLDINGDITPCSVKAFTTMKSTAQTGTTLSNDILNAYDRFIKSFFKDDKKSGFTLNAASITGPGISDNVYEFNDKIFKDLSFIVYENEALKIDKSKRSTALKSYKEFKSKISSEHNAAGVITFHKDLNDNFFKFISKDKCKDLLSFAGMPKNKRISFSVLPNESHYKNRQRVDKLILMLLQDNSDYVGYSSGFNLASRLDDINSANSNVSTNENVCQKNKSRLFEGGKAGHMMHPYENLHMNISNMKRMIEDFRNDFEISEKVDGANLFFTIDPRQGKILFSRNKSDMSHEETLEKFGPDHPAHVLFTDGANAIFNSVKSSLSKQDIQRVFGQSPEGGKTYINFEIMHPQKPNQIKYDMKYIVFHTIVDYDINGNVVESSPDDKRLVHLLNQLQPSFNVANNDFSLGSNLKIKLNNLSQPDVDELLNELNRITSSLGLSDDMTIADAVKSEIRSLLDRENITELLPEDKIEMIYDFITNESTEIKGTAIKKGLDRELQKTLTSLGLTSKTKANKIIKQVIQEFKSLFILLGIKLLDNVQSRYMSPDASNKNVDELRRLLDAAIKDYDNMMQAGDLGDTESKIFKSLTPHIANVRHHGVERVVSSPVEGGVFIGKDGNTYKVTGGFAPLNQILGTAMRSLDYMPVFKEEFVAQERGS